MVVSYWFCPASPRANYMRERSIMGALELVGQRNIRSLGKSSGQETFDGYEQRLARWGCANCRNFEKRVFKGGLRSAELDAYMVCRFAQEPVDLIGEATACPKNSGANLNEKKSKGRRAGLHGKNSVLKVTEAA
jgi:hypothetical protein